MTDNVLNDPAPADPSLNLDPAPNPDPVPAPNADPAPAPPADPAPAPAADDYWRQDIAGDDEKMMNRLSRYSTQKDAIKAGLEAQDKLRTTRSNTLPDDPTEEQLAEYREQNGIPATFGEYDTDLDNGLIIGDDDKPMVDSVLEAMHGANASNDQVKAVLNAYYAGQEAQIEAIETKDNADKDSAISALKDEWGPDFNSNKNALQSIINQIPEASRDGFLNARMADGTAMLNDPNMLMFLADISRKTNPAATVVPNAENPGQAIASEIKQIEGWMQANDAKYWKDEGVQARYRQLLDAKEGMK